MRYQELVPAKLHFGVKPQQLHQHNHALLRDARDQALQPRQRAVCHPHLLAGLQGVDVCIFCGIALRFKTANVLQHVCPNLRGLLAKAHHGSHAQGGANGRQRLGCRRWLQKHVAREQGL